MAIIKAMTNSVLQLERMLVSLQNDTQLLQKIKEEPMSKYGENETAVSKMKEKKL